jgi:hypothetical protein
MLLQGEQAFIDRGEIFMQLADGLICGAQMTARRGQRTAELVHVAEKVVEVSVEFALAALHIFSDLIQAVETARRLI